MSLNVYELIVLKYICDNSKNVLETELSEIIADKMKLKKEKIPDIINSLELKKHIISDGYYVKPTPLGTSYILSNYDSKLVLKLVQEDIRSRFEIKKMDSDGKIGISIKINDGIFDINRLGPKKGPLKISDEVELRKSENYNRIRLFQKNHQVFRGKYIDSENGLYTVVYKPEELLLINNSNIQWRTELERINSAYVSNDGRVVVHDSLKREDPNVLNGKLVVFDSSGAILLEEYYNSNIGCCAISKNGTYVVVSTAHPDNKIHCFSMKYGEEKWSYENDYYNTSRYRPDSVLDLIFIENKIEVWTGKSVATKEKSYYLSMDGFRIYS
jgi:outer membrane protein assembly factor BamB